MNIAVCVKQVPEVADAELEIVDDGRDIDRDDLVAFSDLEAPDGQAPTLPAAGSMTLEQMERAMIEKCVRHYGGNLSRVAEALGLSRPSLYRRLRKYGIDADAP